MLHDLKELKYKGEVNEMGKKKAAKKAKKTSKKSQRQDTEG
jgi:hypothetical protein